MDLREPTVYQRTLGRAIKVAGEANPSCAAFLALTDIVAANFLTPAALANFVPKKLV